MFGTSPLRNSTVKKRSWILTPIVFLAVIIAGVVIAYPLVKPEKKLKIYQPADVNPKLVDSTMQKINRDHRIADFELTDQTGKTITNADFEGKIYVTDFFFATCPTICPMMHANIAELQEEFKNEPKVMFLSHSVTPELDSVPVLKEHGEKYGADPTKWKLTTGDKKEIYRMARKSYFVVLDEGDGGKQDFIHTENFVLVDSKRRIRGYYDGTSDLDMERLTEDIRILLAEEAEENE